MANEPEKKKFTFDLEIVGLKDEDEAHRLLTNIVFSLLPPGVEMVYAFVEEVKEKAGKNVSKNS